MHCGAKQDIEKRDIRSRNPVAMTEAINREVMSVETAYGFVSASDLAGRDG